jgi:hypothetical protein
MQFIDFRGSLRAVDRHGYCRFRANQDVKGTAARGAEGALDILICSEKGWPLRSTAFLERSVQSYIAALALAAAIVVAWIN